MVFKVIGIAFVAVAALAVIKNVKSEYVFLLLIAAGAVILISLSDYIVKAISAFKGIADKSGMENEIFTALLRIIGIGYICDYSASVVEDSGSKSLAEKIQLAGKLTIFIMTVPIVTQAITVFEGLIQ